MYKYKKKITEIVFVHHVLVCKVVVWSVENTLLNTFSYNLIENIVFYKNGILA